LISVTPAGGAYSYTVGGAIQPGNIDLQSVTPNTGLYATYFADEGTLRLRNAEVVTGTDYGTFAHAMPAGIGAQDHYLSVYGGGSLGSGSATFRFATAVTTMAFTWGTIDSYNWLEVTNGKSQTYKITGADLMANVADIKEGTTSKYFSLTDLSGLLKVVLRSSSDSFEVANISISNVPLPAALPLFGVAVAGLAGVRRRRSKA